MGIDQKVRKIWDDHCGKTTAQILYIYICIPHGKRYLWSFWARIVYQRPRVRDHRLSRDAMWIASNADPWSGCKSIAKKTCGATVVAGYSVLAAAAFLLGALTLDCTT